MNESVILAQILLDLGARPGIRVFRNSVGVARDARGHTIRYGLVNGASDIIGWKSAHGVAQFVALEVKSDTGSLRPEQKQFLANVLAAGGIAAVVRSVEEARVAMGVE